MTAPQDHITDQPQTVSTGSAEGGGTAGGGAGGAGGGAGGAEQTLAELHVSGPRHGFALVVLLLLGLLLLVMAWQTAGAALAMRGLIFALGLGALVMADAMRRSRPVALRLTRGGLFVQGGDADGHLLTRIENIRAVDRGALAVKPSNGFTLRLTSPVSRRLWHPGLVWAMGRRIGVGGVTHAAEAKAMAEALSALLPSDS